MAHEISRTDNLVLASTPAWHGLGTVVEQAPSIFGALQIAGLDWSVEQWPLSATDGKTRQLVSSHVLNVRSDTHESLGVVGKGYTPFPNRDLAEFADKLMGEGARVESAGSFRSGQRVWFLVRTAEVIALGKNGDDQIYPYILLANGHDGTLSFTIQPTTIRVVCSNTFHLSLSTSSIKRAFRLRHTSGIKWRVEDARQVLAAHGVVIESFRKQAAALAAAPALTSAEVSAYFSSVFDASFSKPTTSRGIAQRNNTLDSWRSTLASRRNTLDGLTNTPWAAFNAITDWSDHRSGGAKLSTAERQYRGWFGTATALKDTAYSTALALL